MSRGSLRSRRPATSRRDRVPASNGAPKNAARSRRTAGGSTVAPGTFAQDAVAYCTFNTELGWMAAAHRARVLLRLSFGQSSPAAAVRSLADSAADPGEIGLGGFELGKEIPWPQLAKRLKAYAAGAEDDFADIQVDLSHLTPFERRVVERCRQIPYGQTLSYGNLAERAGSQRAARAVGNVMANNRCPLIVPCHRVVHASGALGHYSAPAGRRTKLRLLEQEGAWQDGKMRPPAAAR